MEEYAALHFQLNIYSFYRQSEAADSSEDFQRADKTKRRHLPEKGNFESLRSLVWCIRWGFFFFAHLFLILTLSVGPQIGTTSLIDPECQSQRAVGPSIIDAHIHAAALDVMPSNCQTNAAHSAARPLSDT
jgi:hypothetical protein